MARRNSRSPKMQNNRDEAPRADLRFRIGARGADKRRGSHRMTISSSGARAFKHRMFRAIDVAPPRSLQLDARVLRRRARITTPPRRSRDFLHLRAAYIYAAASAYARIMQRWRGISKSVFLLMFTDLHSNYFRDIFLE